MSLCNCARCESCILQELLAEDDAADDVLDGVDDSFLEQVKQYGPKILARALQVCLTWFVCSGPLPEQMAPMEDGSVPDLHETELYRAKSTQASAIQARSIQNQVRTGH